VLLAAAAIVGVLVAAAWVPPRPVGWLLAAFAGVALALDSPPQALTIAQGNATLVGTALGACAALIAVSLVAGCASRPWQQLGVRILGSWIAASAILVLAVLLK
jgi:urease accessory protein